MMDGAGRVLYVGKAKRIRVRLLSYFRAPRNDKAAKILHAAADIAWEYAPSEFAAHLAELRDIRKWRPPYNVQMNRYRRIAFVAVSADPAPRLTLCRPPLARQRVPLRTPGLAGAGPRRHSGAERPAGPAGLPPADADGVRRAGRSVRIGTAGGLLPVRAQPVLRPLRRAGESCGLSGAGRAGGGFPGGTLHRTDRPDRRRNVPGRRAGGLRGGGAVAGEVRSPGMAARGHHPGPRGGGAPELRVSPARGPTETTGPT